MILQGCRNPNRSVELKRIVLGSKGQGVGRVCVRLLKKMAFAQLGAHRFWLDVKGRNTRAQALYRSEGYVEEGRLRECVRAEPLPDAQGVMGEGFDDLIVMSLLKREFEARVAQGLEPS